MKIITLDSNTHVIYFQNFERIPLRELFQKVVSELQKNGCEIGRKTEACTADIYPCRFLPEGYRFDLVYDDTDDGTSICIREEEAFERLKQIFEYVD